MHSQEQIQLIHKLANKRRGLKWKEHTNPAKEEERLFMALEQEWQLKTADKCCLGEELRVEKD